MPNLLTFFVLLLIGVATGYLAKQRGRDPITWFLVGCILGLLGLLILFVFPSMADVKPEEEEEEPEEIDYEDVEEEEEPFEEEPEPLAVASAPMAEESTPEEEPEEEITEWYYVNAERDQEGPFSHEELQKLHADGIITDETLIWTDGMEDWLPYSDASQ